MTLDELIQQRNTMTDQWHALEKQINSLDDQIRTLKSSKYYTEFFDWAHSNVGKLFKVTLQRGTYIGTLDSEIHTESLDGEPYVCLLDPVGILSEYNKPAIRRMGTPVELWAQDFSSHWQEISKEDANKLISEYTTNNLLLK